MNIMELGAIGELVGGMAVIASLIFVGLQVRQGSHYARIDGHREVHASLSSFMGDIGKDAELHAFYYNGIRSTEQLSLEEADRLGMLLYKMFGFLSTAHR
jgi:hypothetical protein